MHQQGKIHRCVQLTPCEGEGAADACASGSSASIGGWWSTRKGAALHEVSWFRLQINLNDLPAWLQAQVPANQRIAFFELLAQATLCMLRTRENPHSICNVAFSHRCDNAASVGCVHKYFTVNEPLCFALQSLAFHASRSGCVVQVSHVPGTRNVLADHISRFKSYPKTVAQLDPHKEVKHFSVRDVLGPVWDMHCD